MKNKIKILIPLIIIIIIIVIIINPKLIFSSNFKKNKINIEKTNANITELYIYGNHLNIIGNINIEEEIDIKDINITIYNDNELNYRTIYNKKDNTIEFKLSDKKNNGLLLDKINVGEYSILLKIIDNEDKIRYFPLINQTKHTKTEYYTISNQDKINQITITNNNKNNTMNMNIEPSNNNDIYDIVIDAGHGGRDPGACANNHCETDFTLTLAQKLQKKLEEAGLKIKLTREDNNKNILYSTYGENGRVAISGNVKAKYLFSFHLNSGNKNDSGIEIYTTNNIDYSFANEILNNTIKTANANYSNNKKYKISNGIYTRTFLTTEINEMIEDAKKNNYHPYSITTNTTYYYIIRETGGYITGAYTDGRNKKKEYNPYYNSNVGTESYLIELGYLTNLNNLNHIKNNIDKYIEGIAQAIIDKLCVS